MITFGSTCDCSMDHNNSESSSEDEDWFYDSMKRYQQLLMYRLQFTTTNIEFLPDLHSICIAGTVSTTGKNELLELQVPEKLSTPHDKEGLCKDRDFRMITGGFTENQVYQIKAYQNGEKKILASERNQRGVSVYNLGDHSRGVIYKSHHIETGAVTPGFDLKGHTAALAHNTNRLEVVDIPLSKVTRSLQLDTKLTPVDSPVFVSEKEIITCNRCSGELYLCDLRENSSSVLKLSPTVTNSELETWTFCIGSGNTDIYHVVRLSLSGSLIINDVRNLAEELVHANLKRTGTDIQLLQLQFSPQSKNMFSVSGLDENVYIYSLQGQKVKSVFVHDGHSVRKPLGKMKTTSHVWYPQKPNLIFSASEDKTLQAWQFVVENQ